MVIVFVKVGSDVESFAHCDTLLPSCFKNVPIALEATAEVGPISGGGRNKTGVTPRTTTSKPEIRLEENIPQSHAYCQAAVA